MEESLDAWSLGVMAFEMCTGAPAFPRLMDTEAVRHPFLPFDLLHEKALPNVSGPCESSLQYVCALMLIRNPVSMHTCPGGESLWLFDEDARYLKPHLPKLEHHLSRCGENVTALNLFVFHFS
jgi:serine/threonine protein kinase